MLIFLKMDNLLKIKKNLFFIFILLINISLNAEDKYKVFDYEYLVMDDGTVEIKKYLGDGNIIRIPSMIDNKIVTSIGYEAFGESDELIEIVIPNSIISIQIGAFSGCINLKRINIPNSVTYIGGGAFSECGRLTELYIPDSVTEIGEFTFSWCVELHTIRIPNTVTFIGDYAFVRCSSLKKIIIPDSVIIMGNWVFTQCKNLEVISCELLTQPDTWSENWNDSEAIILWNTKK